MVHLNDFKLLNLKCLAYFKILSNEFEFDSSSLSMADKYRLGFYLYMLETLCDVKDTADIVDLIIDTEFNKIVLDQTSNDFGVDAVFIDEENYCINLFNFKFREAFKMSSQQSLNDTIMSSKFLTAVENESTKGTSNKVKGSLEKIIEKNNRSEVWKTKLFVVSNDSNELDESASEIINFCENHGVEVTSIGLDKISKIMSIRPDGIDATLILDKDAVLPFVENSLASSKSYIIKISASDLIRITCDNPAQRKDYQMEDFSGLSHSKMEYNLLFDNVRGLVLRSKINKGIQKTLKEEPTKFFMYNNGLTITAAAVDAEETNAGKKIKLTIKDFQVVNGGQTLRTLHDFNQTDTAYITDYLAQCQLLLRVFNTPDTNNVRNKIAEYTNSQNAISNVDLKSLSYEQVQIEQFLEEHEIIYARKAGDTGLSTNKNYKYKISMEKFGQILFSVQGYPEKTSNQKKQIFDKYYDDIFKTNFDVNDSAILVARYFEIKREYEQIKGVDVTDQKIFYILYIDSKLDISIPEQIDFLEKNIASYDLSGKADARKLIGVKFKESLDHEIEEFC